MNRETKRMLQRQGALNEDGDPIPQSKKRATPHAPKPAAKEVRLPPHKWARRYLREVMAEMRRVNFPNRDEVRSYSVLVFAMLVLLTTAIGLVDFGLSHVILKVFT